MKLNSILASALLAGGYLTANAQGVPTVSLTGPATGSSFAAPANLPLSATAGDTGSTVTNVAFYAGNTLLANVTSAPYTYTTANLFAGSYALTAVATDNSGATATSGVVNVTITNTPALSVLQSIKTVFVIAMENHDLVQKNPTGSPQQIKGNPAAPYFNSLITPGNPNAAQTAWATHMFSAAINGEHPSEPNYIWQEAGTDFGIRTDNDPSAASHNVYTNVQHLSAQLTAAGVAWRSYQEDMQYSSSEEVSVSGSGYPVNPYNGTTQINYAVKHNPMAFFNDTQNQNCYPFTNFWTDLTNNNIGRYNWITPDQYNEWHSSLSGGYTYFGTNYTGDQAAIAEGDNCLSIIIPKIMASAAYQDHGVIIIWTDETESTDDTNTTLPYVIISPLAKGNAYASTLPYSHSSDLKTMDEIFQLAYQTNTIPTSYGGAAYLDAQNTGTNYVDGRSATIYDLGDFFQGVGTDASTITVEQGGTMLANGGSAIAFGSVTDGASASESFTITNTGNGTLVLTNFAFAGVNAGDFSVSGLTFPATVYVGQSVTFGVVFAPSVGGAENASLILTNNDVNNNPFTLVLSGTGVHLPPTVSLTGPVSGTSFAAPANLPLSATAADTDGTVTNVAFYAGSTLLANVTSAPYTYTTANLFAGSYALTAVATDNSGATATSGVVNVTITNTPALSVLQSIKTVFVIAMENHDLVQKNPTGSPQQIKGNPAAPYFNSLITPGNPNAAQTAWATHMFSAAINGEHPSEPNYIWQEAGTDFGIRTDNDPSAASHNVYTNVQHLSAQLTAAGVAWRSYQEDMQYSSSEEVSVSGSGYPVNPYNGTTQINYAVKHNPMAFFPDTQNQNCYPFTNFWTDLTNNNIGRYNWITPDQYNEWHSSLSGGYTYFGTNYTGDQAAIAEGDNCLSIIIPKIMASAAYQDHGVIIIWTDETESTDDTNTTLPYVIISPLAKGNAYASTLPYSHSSDLKTMDEIFQLAYQTNTIPTSYGGAAYLDAQNTGTNYVDGRSATIYDLGDFFQGVGTDAPALGVQQTGAALTNGASAMAFGSVNVGATASETFTVTNAGNGTLVLSNLTLSGVNAADFSVSGITLPATVYAGQSASFSVVFSPLGAGVRAATLQITDNDTNNSQFNVILSGIGVHVPPTINLTNPTNTSSFAAPAYVPLLASVADTDGNVTNVAYYLGSTLVANVASPFTYTWGNVAAGYYSLSAVATDDSGATATSSVVNVLVTNTEALLTLKQIKTIFVIAMENHDLVQKNPTGSPQQILSNPAAPYFNSLITPGNPNAAQTAWATHMFSTAINGEHPSEPNYIWQEAGTDFGIRTDSDPSASAHNVYTNVQHLSAQLTAAGVTWRSYQEDLQYSSSEEVSVSGAGYPVNPYNGTTEVNYAVKHNPMAFFPDTQNQNCYPFTNFWTDLTNNNIGRYNWITPDQYNEWHSSLPGGYTYLGTNYTGDQAAIAEGDNCLSIIIPKIMASKAYQDHGVIIIWTDETESTDDTNTTLPYVIISPLAKGNAYASTLPYSHSSDLKTMDELFGVAYQTNAIPTAYNGAAYLDAQNTATNYVDGRSATIYDLSDFFQPAGVSVTPQSAVRPAHSPTFQFTFTGPPTQTYEVLASTDLNQPESAWSVVSSGTFIGTNVTYVDTTAASTAARYFIVKSPAP